MLKKNADKKERAKRGQTFVGCRPARFKSKKEYNRQKERQTERE